LNGLRVVMIADFAPNPDSGAAGTELAIAAELERQGHSVRTIWEDRLPHRIRHWNLHHLLEQPGALRDAAREALAESPCDVLHVNQPAGWLAARDLSRRPGRPLFVHRSHGFEPRIGAVLDRWRAVYREDERPWPRRAATRALGALVARNYRGIVRHADAHVVSCGECADDLIGRGVARERIHVSPQVPVEAYFAAAEPWSERRARRLLFVGQHVFMKAPMVLAAALEHLLARHPDLEATWVCEASAHERVRSRIRPEVAGRVRLLGWMNREALRQIFDEHGIFLFPSFTEGFGKVFLEAMARGLCVVATDQSGPRDVIRDGGDGLVVPVGDVDGIVAAVERLRREPGLAAAISGAARRTAERYTWRRVVSELADFYRARIAAEAVARKGGGSP
jgi:glycosyltransferase involved in cell wall biosynthesis